MSRLLTVATEMPSRFDLWGRQFEYRGSAAGYRLTSAGADGKPGTNDDLVVENGVVRTAAAVGN